MEARFSGPGCAIFGTRAATGGGVDFSASRRQDTQSTSRGAARPAAGEIEMTRSTDRPLRVGLVQMAPGDEPEANVGRALVCIEEAAGRGAGIVCLPELFRTRYFCQK